MSKYMIVLLISVSIPLLLSFWPPLRLYSKVSSLLLSLGLIMIIFGAWDILATYRQHWYFDPQAVWDIRIVNLPVEEVLFFAIIPFCCIFTWEAMKYIRGRLC